ncbi:MAG: hypothetical protein BME93_01245 [Methanosarcinales archaeon Met12]|nr:MAG: hypothetical protein BME93_01245 [Methanosarcinales archaeon Met12]
MKESYFIKGFGTSPFFRVVDFFIDNYGYDYSKTEIAKGSGMSRVTLNTFFEGLVDMGIIKKTRDIGRAKMYQLNIDSPITRGLIKIDKMITIKETMKVSDERLADIIESQKIVAPA